MTTAVHAPFLALPDGWLVADLTRERLARILSAQGPDVVGVAAPGDRPPPGASYRSHAERLATRPLDDVIATADRQVTGAVMLRSGTDHHVGEGSVTVDAGRLVIDRGAVAFDPWAEPGAVGDASPDGRSPFPYRPLVLILGFDHDAILADWGRSITNGLMRYEVEGRLAVPAPTEGLHLTIPCRPSAASVRALEPDILVALDEEALDRATHWLDEAGDRSTVTVRLTPGTEVEPELVSWRIGEAQGRLRARIGRGTKADALADLVRRLATGPVPVGPPDRPPRPDGQRLLNPRRALNRAPKGPPLSLQALVDPSSPDAAGRFQAIFGHLAPPTHTSVEPITDPISPASATVDVLVVSDPQTTPAISDLVRTRLAAGRPTLIDVGSDTAPSAALDDLVRVAGLALTTDEARRDDLINRLGARAFTLPDLVPGGRVEELAASGEEAARAGRTTIGCDLRNTARQVQRSVRDALIELTERSPDLRWMLVADEPGPLTDLAGRRGVSITTISPRPPEQAGWLASIVASDRAPRRLGLGLVESQLLGVPVICPAGHPASREGLVTPSLTVADPTDSHQWSRSLDDLIHGPGLWERRSIDARALALALYGSASTTALIDRFLGWLHFGGRS